MKSTCINSIDFITSINDKITINEKQINNFYIGNLDSNGDEVQYGINNEYLIANFMLIDISKEFIDNNYKMMQRKNDISEIVIHFKNGNSQKFKVPMRRVAVNGKLTNVCEEKFELNDNLGIIITDKKIKYKKELFI